MCGIYWKAECMADGFLMTGPSGKSWCSAFKCASQPTHNSDCREWKPCWLEVSEHNLCPNHWCTNKLWRYGRDFGQLSTGSKTKQQGSEQSLQWLHSLGKWSSQFWIDKLVTYWNQKKKKKRKKTKSKITTHIIYNLCFLTKKIMRYTKKHKSMTHTQEMKISQ